MSWYGMCTVCDDVAPAVVARLGIARLRVATVPAPGHPGGIAAGLDALAAPPPGAAPPSVVILNVGELMRTPDELDGACVD